MQRLKKYNKYNSHNLKGNNIFFIKNNNQTVYYDWLTKNAYIITDNDALFFQTWQLRLPLSLIAIGFIMLFFDDMKLAIVIGLVLFIILSILFRVLFLKKLAINATFKKPASKGLIRDIASKYSRNALLIIAMLFGSMGASLIINQIIRSINGTKQIVVYSLAAVSLVIVLFVIYVIRVKDKEKL